VEAHGTEHVFVVPSGYAIDFVSVLAPSAAHVRLDGEPLDALARIGTDGAGTLWGSLALSVADGPHRLSSSLPCTLLLGGYDRDVAYGFPGGWEPTAGP